METKTSLDFSTNLNTQTFRSVQLSETKQLLKLAERAVILCNQHSNWEKRRILNFVCSNSTWKEEQLKPNYRQQFKIIAEKKKGCRAGEATFSKEKVIFGGRLPSVDELRNQFANPSQVIVDTVLIAQRKLSDGFLNGNKPLSKCCQIHLL